MSELSLADRATIANMSPEYGATMGFFPVDHVTLQYLKLTGRSDDTVSYLFRKADFVSTFKQAVFSYSLLLSLLLCLYQLIGGYDRVLFTGQQDVCRLQRGISALFYGPIGQLTYIFFISSIRCEFLTEIVVSEFSPR